MGRSKIMGWGPGQRLCEREGEEKDDSPGEETAGEKAAGGRQQVRGATTRLLATVPALLSG